MRIIRMLELVICVISCLSSIGFSYSNYGQVILNIDSPSFRRLVVANPQFAIEPSSDMRLEKLALKTAEELGQLLEFTGYFKVMDPAGYKDLVGKIPNKSAKFIPGFEGLDYLKWKALGVESLNNGKLIRTNEGDIRLELRTADFNKGNRVLGKAYTISQESDLIYALKQYVDRLLMAYTGKPGVFSSKVAFIGRKKRGDSKQLFICDIDGKNLQQLTFGKTPHLSPAWSPDGSQILFTSYESGNPDLYMIDIKTHDITNIAAYQGLNSGGVFSSNGKLIAFSGSIKGNTEIYLKSANINSSTRRPFLQGHGIDVDPAFSPDGKWLAFVSGRYGNPHIFKAQLVWNEEKSQVKAVSDTRLTYAGWYNATPAWTPDSQKIAFAGFDRDIGRFDIFLMNHNGRKLERLTIRSGDNESPTWSPNGQLIIFQSNRIGKTDRKGRSQLYIMNRDGSNQRRIYTGLYDAQMPKWGPFLLK